MPKVRIHEEFPGLKDEQARASRPGSTDVWLSASAGTGKTQVLVARVLRLLLHGARPDSILCLTFTKAAAAEMAIRVNEVLAAWVTLPAPVLARDLINLGEDHGDGAVDRARTLFAKVLDARGGGLRIQTIHSFCQSLLGSFPGEAGLTPGFRPIEGREEGALASSALAEMIAEAERTGQLGLVDKLKALSHRTGEDAARAHLRRCAGAPEAMEALGPAQGIEARVRRWLGGGIDDIEGAVTLACSDGGYPKALLDAFREMNCGWLTAAGTQSADGRKAMERIDAWLAADAEGRYATLDDLILCWRTATGEMRKSRPKHSDCAEVIQQLDLWLSRLLELKRAARIVPHVANALIVGQAYARAYADAKRRVGAVDFNDLIAKTVALLEQPGIGEWIAYKLDQRIDHILVDEAQDTNAAQWSIVRALTQEFFAGEGQKGARIRTLFTVGDYKQAIFGFQGTDPREFEAAQRHFTELAREAQRDPLDLSLSQSFRSSQPILDVVDATVAQVGAKRFGRIRVEPHRSARGGWGSVTLWPPVQLAEEDSDEAEEQSFTTTSERIFATELAKRIKHWTGGGLTLRNQGGRAVRPGDIMILVRSRGELARLIVSRLYEEGVEVAGVDRLRLNAPIAVQDLLAAIRFVLQPNDDLTLACLLVSPLIGWTQDELYEHAKAKRRGSLWQQLGEAKPAPLLDLLGRADLDTPYRFLEHILSGPMLGRRRLIARLGEEARDPIEELVNAALAFEREATPSLQQFVDWFDRGDVDIKRDAGEAGNAVRVMTVHGAKGLQSPIVILADATADPDFKRSADLDWQADEDTRLPLFRPRKEELSGSLRASAQAGDAREREEHWRLLYVAMTRAEEQLFIGGALRPKQAKGMGEDCWHMAVGAAMRGAGAVGDDEGRLVIEGGVPRPAKKAEARAPVALPDPPGWLDREAPTEARPQRPLAPSAIKPDDTIADPPPPAAMREAANRGVLLHGLFERLPGVPQERRRAAALAWLEQARGVRDPAAREELADAALAVIEHPALAAVFSGEALTEAPLAGLVDGQVIAGTVDRLLIADDRVTVVDYKTGRRVPRDAEAVPPHHLAQMAAYAAVLQTIFPGRAVEASLLYSHEAKLILLPPELLARHKPGLSV